jgi:hypothetical protein
MMKLLSYLTGWLTNRGVLIRGSNKNYRLAHSYRMASNIRNLVLSGRYLDSRLDRIDKQWLRAQELAWNSTILGRRCLLGRH